MILKLGILLCLLLPGGSDSLMDSEYNYVPVSSTPKTTITNRISTNKCNYKILNIFQTIIRQTSLPVMHQSRKMPSSILNQSPPVQKIIESLTSEDRYVVKATPKQVPIKQEEPEKSDETRDNEEIKITNEETKQEEAVLIDEQQLNKTNISEEEEPKKENEDKVNTTTGDIPSFSEWTQKALEEEEKKKKEENNKKKQLKSQKVNGGSGDPINKNNVIKDNHPSVSHDSQSQVDSPVDIPVVVHNPNKLKKNFASIDCGAKVVGSNPESQGASNIISPSRDEYMLNKCTDKTSFVIELCESIKALRIEIANFELYSSVPNEFRVSLSNVYPSRDWAHFGTFKAEELRDIQVFDSNIGVYGKYVKVEVLSHHGSEHYCPVSLFRVYGISEIELMANGDDDDDEDHHHQLDYSDMVQDDANKNNKDIVSFIKEKVDETLEKVVGVFKKKDTEYINSQYVHTASLFANLTCAPCDLNQFNAAYYVLSSYYSRLNSTYVGLKHHITKTICPYFFGLIKNTSPNFYNGISGYYYSLMDEPYSIALCDLIKIEEEKDIILKECIKESDEREKDTKLNQSNTSSSSLSSSDNEWNEKEEFVLQFNETTIQPTPVERSQSTSSDSSSSTSSASSSTVTLNQPTKVHKINTMPEPPSVVHVPPPVASLNHQQEEVQQVQQRSESVWQKLTNRIKSLERNVTLSSGYLEELSVQYKKQIEDLQVNVRQSSESLNMAIKASGEEKIIRQRLQSQVEHLSHLVNNLTEKIDSMNSWSLVTHLGFFFMEVLVGFLCLLLCIGSSSDKKSTPLTTTTTVSPLPSKSTMESTPLVTHQRRHSLEMLDHERHQPNKRRRSLDFDKVPDITGLSRRQRRRLNRRLSKVSSTSNLIQDRIDEISSNDDILNCENMFGVLNSSLHGDPTPVKEKALDYNKNIGAVVTRRKHLRSKSTSPARKTEVVKLRENFENFNPSKVEWT